MADIRLITILPAQTVAGVQQPVGTGTGASASILAALPPGTILSGFIINRDAGGNPVLRTAKGDVTFSSQFFLKIGSEVVIRVENTAGRNPLAHIVTVDGRPPEVAETLSSFASAPGVIVGKGLTPQAPGAQTATQPAVTITGTVIGPPADQPATAAPPLPNGTQLALKVSTVNIAASPIPDELAALAPPPTQTTSAAQPSTASYAAYARASGSPAAPLAPATPPPAATVTTQPPTQPVTQTAPQTSIAVTTVPRQPLTTPATPATATPQTPTTTPAAPANPAAPTAPLAPAADASTRVLTAVRAMDGQSFVATVLGNEPSGEAVVQTPVGIVRLQPGTVLPSGSQITFQLTSMKPPDATPTAPAKATAVPIAELARHWDSLEQITRLLTARGAPAGLEFLFSGMPSLPSLGASAPAAPAPPHFSTGLMLFINMLKGGDFTAWLGQGNVRWLEDRGHGALVRKAEGEFLSIARQYAEALPQHWQTLFFPVAAEGAVHQARLFVKRDRNKQGSGPAGKKSDDTRFIIEVGLSQLGEMQMDGFVRKREQDVQFDLVIRSLTPMPAEVQRDILQIYNDAAQLTGTKGGVVFQAVKEFPVRPMEEIAGHGGNVIA